jgi:hypothetical protein
MSMIGNARFPLFAVDEVSGFRLPCLQFLALTGCMLTVVHYEGGINGDAYHFHKPKDCKKCC